MLTLYNHYLTEFHSDSLCVVPVESVMLMISLGLDGEI